MAADLLLTHRIFSTLLEIRRIAITREKQSGESVQRIAQLLLKDSGQKLLHVLDETMDDISKQENKEAVRRTIMEHDKIFRQQVNTLSASFFAIHLISDRITRKLRAHKARSGTLCPSNMYTPFILKLLSLGQ
jgi:hypothetical protein